MPIARRRFAPDPFRIFGPASVSFSGGRTSAFMLWRIVQAHGGRLPEDVLVLFANTGREHPATLDFVRECGARWDVPVTWLEYRRDEETGRVWAEVVNHNSASRNGEPFAAVIKARPYLPNPVTRFCTAELKVKTMQRHLRTVFGPRRKEVVEVVGLRADEPHRVARMRSGRSDRRHIRLPLADAGIAEGDVFDFWQNQPFDLRLPGKHAGNCDGCFLKRRAYIELLWRENPSAAQWWADQEAAVSSAAKTPRAALFRKDWKGGYAAIGEYVKSSPGFFTKPKGDPFDPFLDCGGGCGV